MNFYYSLKESAFFFINYYLFNPVYITSFNRILAQIKKIEEFNLYFLHYNL